MRFISTSLLLLFTLTGCGHVDWWSAEREEYPNIPALEYVVVSYSDELERYKRLFLNDSRAFYDHYVEYVWMKFRTQDIMDVLEARDLLVYVVEGFLARVNEDPEVSGDLYDFPFTADNLIVEIEFDSFYNRYINTRSIGRLELCQGNVSYYARDALRPDTIWFHQRKEPYDKAYRFSKFKSYRPWIKEPLESASEFRELDVSNPSNGGVIPQTPPSRPPSRSSTSKGKKKFSDKSTSSKSTGGFSTPNSFPSSSVQKQPY
jgi:hypothetical protein